MHRRFDRFASAAAQATGHWSAFVLAVALIVGWAASGPLLGFSEMWQMTVNTTTTIVTFLMVFLVQHSQNRDMQAMQTKLDELIRATHHRPAASNKGNDRD